MMKGTKELMHRATLLTAIVFVAFTACTSPDSRTSADSSDASGTLSASDTLDTLDTSEVSDSGVDSMQIEVFFTRDERPVPVQRTVPRSPAVLQAALGELMRGPTPDERAEGLWSFFSEETAGMLHAVRFDKRGRAIVDFEDLRPVIPNASTSAGSAILMGELNSTIFQFPTVQEIEYRIDGSCEVFGEWLQYGCQIIERPEE